MPRIGNPPAKAQLGVVLIGRSRNDHVPSSEKAKWDHATPVITLINIKLPLGP